MKSGLRTITTFPPTSSIMITGHQETWKIGRTKQVESSLVTSLPRALAIVAVITLRWLSMTPLGVPVVPPVYIRTARSSSPTWYRSGSGSWPGASASAAS